MNTVGCDKLGMDLLINWKAGLHESGKSSGGFRLQFLVCEVQTMKISTLLSGEAYMKSCVCNATLRCTVSTLSIQLMAIQSVIIINEKSILTWGRRLARHALKLAAKWQENGYGGQQPEAQRLDTHLPCHVGTRVHGAGKSGSHEQLTALFPLPLTFAPIPGPLCCREALASVRLTSCRRAKSKREEDSSG